MRIDINLKREEVANNFRLWQKFISTKTGRQVSMREAVELAFDKPWWYDFEKLQLKPKKRGGKKDNYSLKY